MLLIRPEKLILEKKQILSLNNVSIHTIKPTCKKPFRH